MKGFLILTCIVSNSNGFDYMEHHVKLGDPWNVSCHTPFKEPTNWVFISARVDFFKNYLYNEGKLDEYMIGRYNLTISDDKHTNTLQINKTDEYHAGRYACIPDRTTLEHRQFHKLTLVEYSNIELKKIINEEILLNMNISFLGFETSKSAFICFFTYGSKEYLGNKSKTDKSFKTYSFIKIYEPDEEVPSRCQILIKNGKPKTWMEKSLHIDPDIDQNEYNEHYVEKGSSWNMSCRTSFHHPMKWYFQGVTSNGKNVTLYKYWRINANYIQNYNFSFEAQSNTYTMTIPRADVNNAGTYTCTHQSSDHLIERIISLIILDNLQINFEIGNKKEPSLTMIASYVGFNVVQPYFSCQINNDTHFYNDSILCGKLGNELILCVLSTTFSSNASLPEKCQINLGPYKVEEQLQLDDKIIVNEFLKDVFVTSTIVIETVLIIILFSIIGIFLRKKLIRHFSSWIKKQSTDSDETSTVNCLEKNDSAKNLHSAIEIENHVSIFQPSIEYETSCSSNESDSTSKYYEANPEYITQTITSASNIHKHINNIPDSNQTGILFLCNRTEKKEVKHKFISKIKKNNNKELCSCDNVKNINNTSLKRYASEETISLLVESFHSNSELTTNLTMEGVDAYQNANFQSKRNGSLRKTLEKSKLSNFPTDNLQFEKIMFKNKCISKKPIQISHLTGNVENIFDQNSIKNLLNCRSEQTLVHSHSDSQLEYRPSGTEKVQSQVVKYSTGKIKLFEIGNTSLFSFDEEEKCLKNVVKLLSYKERMVSAEIENADKSITKILAYKKLKHLPILMNTENDKFSMSENEMDTLFVVLFKLFNQIYTLIPLKSNHHAIHYSFTAEEKVLLEKLSHLIKIITSFSQQRALEWK